MRIVLSMLALIVAASARADWVKVTATADAVYYVDPASIRDRGESRLVSVIQDYPQPEPGGVRSRRVSYEMDCAEERLRSLGASEHAEPMAQGKAVNSWERESEWLYVASRTGSNIPSRTPYKPILKFVCSR